MATRYAELVRYGLVAHDDGSDRMEPVANGQWVRADEAAAAITALEAALKPFAEAAESIDDDVSDRAEMWEHPASMQVTAGDFRRAASIESKP